MCVYILICIFSVLTLLIKVRGLVARLRHLERETYLVQKTQTEGIAGVHVEQDLQDLQKQVMECKEQLTRDGEVIFSQLSFVSFDYYIMTLQLYLQGIACHGRLLPRIKLQSTSDTVPSSCTGES